MIQTVKLDFLGIERTLQQAGTNQYSVTFAAPIESSWPQDEHSYFGTVTATDTDGNEDSGEFSLRVKETDKPIIAIQWPINGWVYTDGKIRADWYVSDDESGIESITLRLNGSIQNPDIAIQADGAYHVVYESATLPDGAYNLSLQAVDNDGNEAELVTSVAVVQLITDRTQADVNRSVALAKKINGGTATEAEESEYSKPLKGAYSYTDMNRVATSEYYIAELLRNTGYSVGSVTAYRNFGRNTIPTIAQLTAYMQDAKTIHDAIPQEIAYEYDLPSITVSNMSGFAFQMANDIERMLVLVVQIIERGIKNRFAWVSGEIASGES